MSLTLYTSGTGNGQKPILLLEYLQVPYKLVKITLASKEQKTPQFLKLNPNGKIPVLVVNEGEPDQLAIFESEAILQYIAHTYDTEHKVHYEVGDGAKYWQQQSWVNFQSAGPGPIHGQLIWFVNRTSNKEAIERFSDELKRLYSVYDQRLSENNGWLVGDGLNVSDIIAHPHFRRYHLVGLSLDEFPALKEWVEKLEHIQAFTKVYQLEW